MEAAEAPPDEAGRLRITASGLAGPLCSLWADVDWGLKKVRSLIEAETGIPSREQRLLAGTEPLRGSERLSALLGGRPASEGLHLTLVRREAKQAEWLETVQRHPERLQEAPDWAKADREICMAAVVRWSEALRWCSPEIQDDREVALAAVSRSGGMLSLAAPEELRNRTMYRADGTSGSGLRLVHGSSALQHCSEALRGDPEIVLAAVTHHPQAMLYSSPALRSDRDFVLQAVKLHGEALVYCDRELQLDREIRMASAESLGHPLVSHQDRGFFTAMAGQRAYSRPA